MKCVVLCAGYATRLYPLTIDKPKALLPIRGVPILEHIVRKLEDLKEIDEIFIVTNDKFYSSFVWWLQTLKMEMKEKIEIVNDGTLSNDGRLGGVGDLNFVINSKNLNDDILVILGDNYFNFDLRNFSDFFKQVNGIVIGVVSLDKYSLKNFGVVSLEGNRVVDFEEKPENPKSNLASTGIYLFTKEDLKLIKSYMKTDLSKEGPGYLIKDFIRKKRVYAYKFEGWWFDVGSIEDYEKLK